MTDDYDLYEKDFFEFVRRGIIDNFGDHPGNGMKEAMEKIDAMEIKYGSGNCEYWD